MTPRSQQIQPLLEQRFGGWRAPAEALPKKNIASVALAAKPRVFLIDRPGAEQSQIVAATVGPTRADPDHIRFVALDTMLGGNFTSRLNMNLREDKHWSYGARHALTDAIGQGTFRAGAGVQTDKTAESMVEIRKELRDVLDDAQARRRRAQVRARTASPSRCRATTRPRTRSPTRTARSSPSGSRTATGTTSWATSPRSRRPTSTSPRAG